MLELYIYCIPSFLQYEMKSRFFLTYGRWVKDGDVGAKEACSDDGCVETILDFIEGARDLGLVTLLRVLWFRERRAEGTPLQLRGGWRGSCDWGREAKET